MMIPLITRNLIKSLAQRLANWPPYAILAGSGSALRDSDPKRYDFAWFGLMLVSLLWGIFSIWVWSTSYWLLSRYSELPSLLPGLALAVFFCLWLYRRGMLAFTEIASGPHQNTKPLVLILMTIGLVMIFISIRGGDSLGDFYLPEVTVWLRPFEKHFRVLLLAPLWGAWAMMIAPKFCRLSPAIEPAISAFAVGCGPVISAITMALPLGGSLFYFHFLGWVQLIIPVATVASAIGGTMIICRLGGGVSRSTLVAANVLTQLVFMLSYLAARNAF